MNQCVLVGKVVELPTVKTTANGNKTAHLLLEVQRNFRNSNGEYESDIFNVLLWRGIAEDCCHVCSKGSLVGVKGRLSAYNNKVDNGTTYYNAEIVAEKVSFLSIKQ